MRFQFPPQEARLIPSATTEITVTVSGEGLTAPLLGTATRANPPVVFNNVPPGAKLVLALSKTDTAANLPATMAAATTSVTAGATSQVTIELQPVKPPSRVMVQSVEVPGGFAALQNSDTGETLFVNNNGGLQWGGITGAIFTTPVTMPNGIAVGQTVSQTVTLHPSGSGEATMKFVGITGVGVPAGNFANCIVVELILSGAVNFRHILYLARQFGLVMQFDGAPLGFVGQPTEPPILPSVLVGGQVGGTAFSMASPMNLLAAPAYDGQLSAYLPLTTDNRYDFSQLLSPDEPPTQPFP